LEVVIRILMYNYKVIGSQLDCNGNFGPKLGKSIRRNGEKILGKIGGLKWERL